MSRKGWLLFVAMGCIWGLPYLLIKIAVDELPPASLVLARCGIGAALLVPIAAIRRQLRPVLRHWRPLLGFTLVEICGPWLLLGYAEQRLSSSLTGLLVAGVPLVAAVLVQATGQERLGRRRASGLLVGFVGVAAVVGFDIGTTSAPAMLAMSGVALGYAIGNMILSTYLSELPGLGVMAASLFVAAAIYLPIGVARWPTGRLGASTWLAVAGLAVICTATAFVVFFKLIAEVGPARASVITFVNPATALLLGVLVLDEGVTVSMGAGFVLILLGSVLATSKKRIPQWQSSRIPLTAGSTRRRGDWSWCRWRC